MRMHRSDGPGRTGGLLGAAPKPPTGEETHAPRPASQPASQRRRASQPATQPDRAANQRQPVAYWSVTDANKAVSRSCHSLSTRRGARVDKMINRTVLLLPPPSPRLWPLSLVSPRF